VEIAGCFSPCLIASVARAGRLYQAVSLLRGVMNKGHSPLDYRCELGWNSVLIVRRHWVLSLCTVFSDCFYGTITKSKILGYYCLNGGLYHKAHVIVEFRASGSRNAVMLEARNG